MLGTLFVIATPIGNLQDMTFRAVETLRSVSLVCCEDTRVTKKLLEYFEARTQVMRIDAHATARDFARVLDALKSGSRVAVVSDAGTPAISDPGAHLIEYILKHEPEIPVVPIPGPSAVTAALSVLGHPFSRFSFYGFPPVKKGRAAFFEMMLADDGAIVFYESVHRIKKTLRELVARAPERQAMIARELTKQFESVYRGSIVELAARDIPEKGEFVVVLAPQK